MPAIRLRPSWSWLWLAPPILLALVLLGTSAVDFLFPSYPGFSNLDIIHHRPTLAEAEAALSKSGWPEAEKHRRAADALAYSLRQGDVNRDAAINNAIIGAVLLVGSLVLLVIRPGRLFAALNNRLAASPQPGEARPGLRLTFKSGKSYSAATVYTLATASFLMLALGVLLIVFVANQPNGPGNIAPLVFGGVFILAGLMATPFQLWWVVLLHRQQREHDRDAELRQQRIAAFQQQAAQGSARFDTGERIAAPAAAPEFRIDLPPPPRPEPPPPQADAKPADDAFRIDLPPSGSTAP